MRMKLVLPLAAPLAAALLLAGCGKSADQPKTPEQAVAEASKIDRTAKGRGDGDAWVGLERLLLAIADAKAVRLLVA